MMLLVRMRMLLMKSMILLVEIAIFLADSIVLLVKLMMLLVNAEISLVKMMILTSPRNCVYCKTINSEYALAIFDASILHILI